MRRWAEEIYCDLFAAEALGPAYLASFSTFALTQAGAGGAEEASKTHPADIVRICAIHDVLQKRGLILPLAEPWSQYQDVSGFFFNMVEERTKLDRKYTRSGAPSPQVHLVLEDFVDVICEEIDQLDSLKRPLTSADLSRIGRLVDRLSKGIPIASHHDPGLIEKAKLGVKRKDLGSQEIGDLKKAVEEPRTLLWEIVNAGWVYKIQNVYPKAFNLFFESNEAPLQEKIVGWGHELEVTDKLLLKSIESSEIQRLMEERLGNAAI